MTQAVDQQSSALPSFERSPAGHAMPVIRDGQLLAVDGSNGVVRLISEG